MWRLTRFTIFFLAAVHLLLLSICPVNSSRIYETNDAVVIEVDVSRSDQSASTRSARSSNYVNPPPIPMAYAINPYTGLYHPQQPQPNLLSWLYPLRSLASDNVSDVKEDSAAIYPESKQTIACGVGPEKPPARQTPTGDRIVGGTEAVKNSWPFIVGLRYDNVDNSIGTVDCGGSLISPTRILTAAHCVERRTLSEIEALTVSLGMHTQGNLPKTSNDAQQTRRVTRVVYHKDYNYKTSFFDIAILTIDPPITYSKNISPICLAPSSTEVDQFVDKDAAIMGWGALKFKGSYPNALQQNTVQIISNTLCKKQYGANVILNQQLCASAPGKDTCQGDSGGPLVVQAKEGSTSWTQVGVVSYGNGCATPNYAGIYASVSFFRKWIDTYMKQ